MRFQASRFQDSRDSLREEILQNLNENLAEHEVVTWTIVHLLDSLPADTVKVERVTDRTKFQVSDSTFQDSRVRVETVRDTVYVERRDTVVTEKTINSPTTLNSKHSTLNFIKWLTALICAITVLIITIKVCLRRFF